jgi:hypothetical protein
MKCPIQADITKDTKFVASFKPKLKEFWLSQNKGVILAGAEEFPFSIFFAPTDSRPIETLLVVECDNLEMCVRICGSSRAHESVPSRLNLFP